MNHNPERFGRFKEFGRSRQALLSLLCALSFLVYAAAVLTQGQYHLSIWGSDLGTQLSGAVSYAAHGAPLGTFDSQVQAALVNTFYQHNSISAAVLRAAQPNTAGGYIEIAKDGVGVGYMIFTSLSMKVFGARIDAIPLGMLALLGLSALIFTMRFRGARLIVVPFLFVVLAFILITPVTTDLTTIRGLPIGGSRYMGVIGILPAIHILYELLELPASTRGETWRNLILFVGQAGLLVFAVIVRSGAGYFLVAIGLLSLVVLWRGRRQRARRIRLLGTWTSLAAASVVVLAVMVISVPSEYVSSGRFFGNFWHRVFISVSLHPGWPYGNLKEMFPCTNAFPEGLGPRLDPVGWCAWYATQTPAQLSSASHNFYDRTYERVMRDALFRVIKAYPREVFETFVYEKSKLIRATLLEAVAVDGPREPSLLPPAIPFVAVQLLIFAACVIIASFGAAREMVRLAGVFASLFLLSLIPLYAVYSYLYVSLDPVIYMYALFAIGATLIVQGIAAALRYVKPNARRATSFPSASPPRSPA
jgi:hypothetical protein